MTAELETEAKAIQNAVASYWPRATLTAAQADRIRAKLRAHDVPTILAAIAKHFERQPDSHRPKWEEVEDELRRLRRRADPSIQRIEDEEIARIVTEWRSLYGPKPAWWLAKHKGYEAPSWPWEIVNVGTATIADYVAWRDCGLDMPMLEHRCRGSWPTEEEEAGGYQEVDDPEHEGQRIRVADFRMRRAARERLIQRLDVRVRNLRTFGPVTVAQKALWRGLIVAAARGGPAGLLQDEFEGVSPF